MNDMRKPLLSGMLVVCLLSLLAAQSFAETAAYLQLAGVVDKYGNDPAMGWLKLFAKNGGWAKAHVIFFLPRLWHLPETSPTGVHIYGFKLVNASLVDIRKSGARVEGNWTGFHIFWNGSSIKSLVEAIRNPTWIKTQGNLTVTDAYTVFTLSLEGMELITGRVVRSRIIIITTEDVPEGDFNFDSKVDVRDIAQGAKAYGTMIGDLRYDLQADVNFDFCVDIRDIARIGRNFGKSY